MSRILAVAALATIATPASAVTVATASWSIHAYDLHHDSSTSGSALGSFTGSIAASTGSVGLGGSPYPAVAAHAVTSDYDATASAHATLRYYYVYTAADEVERQAIENYASGRLIRCRSFGIACTRANAPLVTIGGSFALDSAKGLSLAYISLTTPYQKFEEQCGGPGHITDYCGNGSGQLAYGALAPLGGLDFGGWIDLEADAYVGRTQSGCSIFYADANCTRSNAYIDPVIALYGPLEHGRGTFTLSSGFVNAAGPADGPVFGGAEPEPAAWALMIGGFGIAGAARRSRRRKFATSA